MTDVLYLAHDLSDAAVRRRVLMLKAGGARVTVAGFQRAGNMLADDPEVRIIVLGRTADARMGQRVAAVLSASVTLKRKLADVTRPDVILARNLEMLALAGRASNLFGGETPIVYECLDIHRLLLDNGSKGRMLRTAEGYFGRNASLILTSSPAFIENYFEKRSRLDLPTLLLENKVLNLGGRLRTGQPRPAPPSAGEPWRIGWFGALRCRKSLQILTDFARQMEGKIEIVLRGRPAYSEFEDFDRLVREAPHVHFAGPYRNPEDLAEIYRNVHFTWAIDFFEEGLNSDWLLPNRLYEGSLYGAVPIALCSTETGRFLQRKSIGLTLKTAAPEELAAIFDEMNASEYSEFSQRMAMIDPSSWVSGPEESRALVQRLSGLYGSTQPSARPLQSPLQSGGTP
ncbi:succinoglycan biosynthesis protein ExoL [Pseudorhizobium tarimense]|uniref:Succinoglycan biosynthesis protein ExoL n=1 Tax=Pseudorhizobium tarimense TaxID=1079109 RepID=A0ABV2H0T9_9HYPH|nr:glycosyltransferase [Pseudorhizobium tarimense]MCJ8517469.1 glycosyl transferase family 1 [Pseudorhizobium tarimense]